MTVPDALRFLFPKYEGDPILLQYALRVLEHHPVGITFFYIPQVVQALRTDSLGVLLPLLDHSPTLKSDLNSLSRLR